MQEQNFEKQVQFTLDELSLTPSAPVWQKVEQEIRQKKKRRRVIAFWLFALLLSGGGAFWGLYSTGHLTGDETSKRLSATPQSSSQPFTPPSQELTSTTQESATAEKVNKETPAGSITSAGTLNNSTPAASTTEPTSLATKTPRTNTKEKQLLAFNTGVAKTNQPKSRSTPTSRSSSRKERGKNRDRVPFIDTEETGAATGTDALTATEETSTANQPFASAADTTTMVVAEAPLANLEEAALAVDSPQVKKAKQATTKWSWAAQAGYGISSLQKDFLSRAMFAPETYSDPLNNSGSPTPPAFNQAASSIEKGAAFHIGFSAKRHFNKRFAISTGLQYSSLTIKSKVGQVVEQDTIIVRSVGMDRVVLGQYYRAPQSGPLKDYTNNYHFIELPIGLEWQLHKRLPLRLQSGVNLSYMVATNALLYDRTAGIYYKSDEQFRKAQLHIFNGLTYRIWQHKKYGIHVGPFLQFGLSSLQKENSNRHLFSTGVKTQVTF